MISNTLKDQAVRGMYERFAAHIAKRIGRGVRDAHQFVIGETPGKLDNTLNPIGAGAMADVLLAADLYRAFPFVVTIEIEAFKAIQSSVAAEAAKTYKDLSKAGLSWSVEKTVGEIFMASAKKLVDQVASAIMSK